MHPDAAPSTSPRPAFAPAAAQTAAPGGAPPAAAPTRRLSSTELLGSARELQIIHGDALYRLRLTSQGKLILTK